MERRNFDRFSRAFTQSYNRRDALRVLGLAAIGASSAGLLAPASGDARRKKRKVKKVKETQPANICQPGKQFATVNVPATGAAVTSPALVQGQRYRLRASGFWVTNAQYGNDAFAAFPFADVNKPETTYQGTRLGLSVDGGSADQWGSYNAGHTYERTVTGTGAALSFRFTDPAANDNSGSINVVIECA